MGTPAFLAISSRFQTQVHSVVASPSIYPLSPVCCRLPLGTRFHSSHKPSLTSSNCRSTSTGQVAYPAFLAIFSRFQTQVHPIVASAEISPISPGCLRLPLGNIFILAISRHYHSRIVGTPVLAKRALPPFWSFKVGSRHKSTP